MNIISQYYDMMRVAPHLDDDHVYDSHVGEMNPEIVRRFLTLVESRGLPKVIWEPFAGTSFPEFSRYVAGDLAEDAGFEMVAYGMKPHDSRIVHRDSTLYGPRRMVGGMIFHPPYYGTSPFTDCEADLSTVRGWRQYVSLLEKVIVNGLYNMPLNALVCAVGRNYRHQGAVVKLLGTYLNLFSKHGFVLEDVWKSEPDIVVVFRNEM